MKKKLVFFFVTVLFYSIIASFSFTAFAYEIKSFDISVGTGTETVIFTMPESQIQFSFNVEPLTKSIVPNVKMTVNNKVYENASNSYLFFSSQYVFKKGAKIKISISDKNSGNQKARYRVNVYLTKWGGSYNLEKESNDTKKTATKMSMKKDNCNRGVVQQYDKDWWVFTAPSEGKYKIEGNNSSTGYHAVKCKIYIGKKRICSTKIGKGTTTIMNKKLKKGTKVYVYLYGGGSNYFYDMEVKKVK